MLPTSPSTTVLQKLKLVVLKHPSVCSPSARNPQIHFSPHTLSTVFPTGICQLALSDKQRSEAIQEKLHLAACLHSSFFPSFFLPFSYYCSLAFLFLEREARWQKKEKLYALKGEGICSPLIKNVFFSNQVPTFSGRFIFSHWALPCLCFSWGQIDATKGGEGRVSFKLQCIVDWTDCCLRDRLTAKFSLFSVPCPLPLTLLLSLFRLESFVSCFLWWFFFEKVGLEIKGQVIEVV